MLDPDSILFNPIKHHLEYVIQLILDQHQISDNFNRKYQELLSIGANQTDIYTGFLRVGQIKAEICEYPAKAGISSIQVLISLLGRKGYKQVILSDGSVWTLRLVEKVPGKFHIHPSRFPPYTVRIHGNAWKTVIAVLMKEINFEFTPPHLEEINAYRLKVLNLSPVKSVLNLKEIIKTHQLLISRMPRVNL